MSSNRSYLSSLSQLSSRECRALLLINTKVKNPAAIERATRQDVTSVVFKHETSTADSILNDIAENVPNKTCRVTSVACLLHVSGSAIYCAGGETGLRLSVFDSVDTKNDKLKNNDVFNNLDDSKSWKDKNSKNSKKDKLELQTSSKHIEIGERAVHFFYMLVKSYMQDTPVIGIKPRIDFFMLDVLAEARKIIKALEQTVNAKLKASYDENLGYPKEVDFICNINTGQTLSDPEQETFLEMYGKDDSSGHGSGYSVGISSNTNITKHSLNKNYQHLQSTVAAIYFRPDKLKTLAQNLLNRSNFQSQSSMDAFEKIKKVGQGAYGTAVLYKRKDDGNQVMGT